MSNGNKLIQKVRRRAKNVKKSLDGDFKRSDKADQRPSVLSDSPGAYKAMRGSQRRMDKSFGVDTIAAKPLCAVNLNMTTVERYDTGGSVYAIKLTMPAPLLTFAGFRPNDVVQFLNGALEGKYLKVASVIDSTHMKLEDDTSFIANPGVKEKTTITCKADVAGSLNSKSFDINSAEDDTEYYVWYNVAGAGVDPTPVGKTAIPVAIASGAAASVVGAATRVAIGLVTDFVVIGSGATVIVENAAVGDTTNTADVDTTFTIVTTTQGEDFDPIGSESDIKVRFEASSVKKSYS